jgi:hypothetical protein
MRVLIAMDCDGTVDIANGPIPLAVVRGLTKRPDVVIFIIGNHALKNFVEAPLASDWLGLTLSGLEYPGGGKSKALEDWKSRMPGFDRYIVVDDQPAQYLRGWEGWEFYLPVDFMVQFVRRTNG